MSNKPILAPSPVQQEVARQASNFYRAVEEYRNCLPDKWATPSWQAGGFCPAERWRLSTDYLDGDYDLDDSVAQPLIAALVNSDGADGDTPVGADASWLRDYMQGKTSGAVSSNERYWSETRNAVLGPGSLPANVNSVPTAVHANIEEQGLKRIDKIKGAVETMHKSGLQKIHINKYLTLYNGNKSGKGRARPRLRISNLPIRIAQPSLSMMDIRSMSNGYHNARKLDGDTLKAMAKNRASQHWSGRLSLRGFGTSGVLAVAPSVILDAMSSIERDVDGDWAFSSRKFALASARSQSGNLLGLATSTVVTVGLPLAVAAVGFVLSAPIVILIGLGLGIFVTVMWNAKGGADWAEDAAKRALER